MNRFSACLPLLAALLASDVDAASVRAAASRPNIVFMLADDLGYGDLGSFGQKKIRTPHLDQLAAFGMRLTRHYAGNAVCAPSRCVLMTGMHPGHAQVRNNRELKPEGQHPLKEDTVTLARLLQAHGYATGAFGKWGLGGPGSAGDPLRQGFDRFYGFNCQRVAHNFYPTYLWDNDRKVALNNPTFSAHQKFPLDADAADPASYARYSGPDYSADFIAEAALKFVRANKDRPFLLYVPTTVPHLALQVPEDSLKDYEGAFPEEPYLGDHAYLPHRTPRAAYAAMITRMDREMGRIIDLIRNLGLEDNTLFVFSSDNGPLYDRLGGTDAEFFQSALDLRGRKGSLYEGGIRVPTLVSWKGKIEPGSVSDRVSGFEDWLPTLLELAGLETSIPARVDGISMASTLLGGEQAARPFLYREFPGYGGQQALWMGDWKAVRQRLKPAGRNATPRMAVALYHLKEDPNETTDVSGKHPDVLARMIRIMKEQHVPSEAFPMAALDDL